MLYIQQVREISKEEIEMKEWKQPEMLDLRIALTAGATGVNSTGHSGHVLPTPIPTLPPVFDDESEITL